MWARAFPTSSEGDNPAAARSTLVPCPTAVGELGGHYFQPWSYSQFPRGELASWIFSGMTFVETQVEESQAEALW